MKYFVRPSKSELLRTKEEISLINEFIELMDQRANMLTQEKKRLQKILSEKYEALLKYKLNLQDQADSVLSKIGIFQLKRLSHFTAKGVQINMKKELIAGVEYEFPYLLTSSLIPYPLSLSDFEIDELQSTTKNFMENVVDLSKYKEAEKRISHELRVVKRKINALQNIILPEMKESRRKIKRFLDEKERFDKVIKMNIIEEILQEV